MNFLSEEIYKFAGKEICVKSNSIELMSHLRAVYGRFHERTGEPSSQYRGIKKDKSVVTIEIIDNLSGSNEITINDGFYIYRVSKYNGSYRWTSQDIATKTENYTGTCDLLHFVQTIVLRTVTLLINDYPLFHAGVVSWRGKGIILPAHPDMGKTTLVIKLVMSGCKFLSDEIACFRPDLSLLEAFPRRVSIRNNSRKILGLPEWPESMDVIKSDENEWMLDIEDIVPDSLSATCPPHSIFFVRGFGDRPGLEEIPVSVSLMELLKFTYCAVDDPASLLFKCAPMVNKLRCYNLVSGNIDETARLIMDEVDRRGAGDG